MKDNDVPFAAFEAQMMRYELTIKRLVIALIIAVVLIFASNVAWLWFFNQFDYASDMVTLDSRDAGNASYIGSDGVIDNGRGTSQEN